MASVPLSIDQLEQITIKVAQELLESWAINDRFPEEESDKYSQYAVDDTILIINKFMEQFNQHMLEESQKVSLIKE